MNHNKQRMRLELQVLMHKYRVASHREWNKAIDDMCAELQRMKMADAKASPLRTASEWQGTLNRVSTKRSFIGSLKHALKWRE